MKLIESSLIHSIIPPRRETQTTSPTVILLHGRGADEHDLLGLSEYLDDRVLIVSVRAPFRFQFGGGFTWYDLQEVGSPDPTMFMESFSRLEQFQCDVISSYPVDPKKIFLLGFSMGTVMSYSLALTKPEAIAGVIANSGYLPENVSLEFKWNELSKTDFFVAHGVHDPVIPIQFGRRANELLTAASAKVHYHEYPMAHEISNESLTDMTDWLKQRIDDV